MSHHADEDEAHPDDALDTAGAAKLLGLSSETLAQWRWLGKGPRFFRAGTRLIRYVRHDVIAWRDSQSVGRRAP